MQARQGPVAKISSQTCHWNGGSGRPRNFYCDVFEPLYLNLVRNRPYGILAKIANPWQQLSKISCRQGQEFQSPLTFFWDRLFEIAHHSSIRNDEENRIGLPDFRNLNLEIERVSSYIGSGPTHCRSNQPPAQALLIPSWREPFSKRCYRWLWAEIAYERQPFDEISIVRNYELVRMPCLPHWKPLFEPTYITIRKLGNFIRPNQSIKSPRRVLVRSGTDLFSFRDELLL